MTMGMIAVTRSSTMAVVQVVQPRFDPPATTKSSTSTIPPCFDAENSITVSIARTTAFVIGNRASQMASSSLAPPCKNLSQP